MGYTANKAVKPEDLLRMCWRHCDGVTMGIREQDRADAEALIERVNALQDEIAGLIRDLRATK